MHLPRHLAGEYDPSGARLKVLSVAHSAVTRAIGRVRYEAMLAECPGLDLTLVVPDRWREYGRTLRVEPPSHGLDIRIEPVRLPHVPKAGWYLHSYPRLPWLLRELRPDVIHLWEEPWSVVALQAARLRDRLLPDTALVLETDQNILRRMPPPFERIRSWTLRRTDLMIGRGDESLDVARATGFAGPAATVEYGLDRTFFRPGAEGRAGRNPLSPLILGYVGRIVREKGLLDVLDAIAIARSPTMLHVMGDGPDAPALQEKAAALGLSGRLLVLPPGPPEEVARFMGNIDILVLMSRTTPTWKEQFGRVVMEAQGCGTPVIGSSSGSIPGVVGPGGWIVGEGDAAALGALLDRLHADPGAIKAARAAGLTQADTRFSFARVGRTLGRAMIDAARARGRSRARGGAG